MTDTAQIITSYGRRYIVRTPDGQTYDATTRKKRVDFACGDQVRISPINGEQVVIEDYLRAKDLLYRQDAWKTKLIAANVTQLLIVTAASPSPSEALLQRALLAAEAAGIDAVIVLNKADLPETAQWREKLKFYETLGYPVVETNALENADILRPILEGQTNILLGQSGMGKFHPDQRPTRQPSRPNRRHFHCARLRQTHHHPRPTVRFKRRNPTHRFPRPARIRPAPSPSRRFTAIFPRPAPPHRPVPFPQLHPPRRARLRRQSRCRIRRSQTRAYRVFCNVLPMNC